jgi:hypothetical protein
MNQLEIGFGKTNRAEIFTRSVSLQDHSSLKISAQTDHPKWEIVSKGGFPLNISNDFTFEQINLDVNYQLYIQKE